jgi:hypothetical protein
MESSFRSPGAREGTGVPKKEDRNWNISGPCDTQGNGCNYDRASRGQCGQMGWKKWGSVLQRQSWVPVVESQLWQSPLHAVDLWYPDQDQQVCRIKRLVQIVTEGFPAISSTGKLPYFGTQT